MSGAGDTTKPETLISTGVAAGPETANMPSASPWKIVAIGNRPHDHLVRDNLFGSLIRDRRGKAFQVLVREPLSWMAESVQHMPEPQRRTALQVVVLNFLCQRTYADFVASVSAHSDASADQGVLAAIQQAQRCWPAGALLEPGPGVQAADSLVCKQAYLCPWCHGRRVRHLYRSLRPRYAESIPFRWLLQIRFEVSIDDLYVDSIRLWNQFISTRNATPSADANAPWMRVPIHYVHDEIKEQLRDKIGRLRLQGGILAYQLGPGKASDGHLGFSHRLGLLGEITFDSQADEDAYFRSFSRNQALLRVCGRWRRAAVLAVPAENPQALRLLLAGSSVNYPTGRLNPRGNVQLFGTPERDAFIDGVPGVLALQPLYMFDNDGLRDYVAAMTGIHLYDRFGSWRVSKPVEPPNLANLQSRQNRASLHRQLQSHNDRRQQEAADKRAALLEVAKRLWPQVQQQAQQKPRGRPPYRQVLKDMLQQQGAQASDRDVRWLSRMLNPPTTGTADTVETTDTDTTGTDDTDDPAGS